MTRSIAVQVERRAPPCTLLEDDDVVALGKPHGVPTHRPDARAQDGIYEWARSRTPEWKDLALVHRLDRDTSGVLVLAKSARARKALHDALAGRKVEKRYLFLTPHAARPARQTCDDAIGKPRRGRVSEDPDGAPALTDFSVLERRGRYDLVLAHPRTGRTHQVRLHAARLGMPIVGDPTYGGERAARLFLHAERIALEVPWDTRRLEAHAPLPRSFDEAARARGAFEPVVAIAAALEAREALFDAATTQAFRWVDGEGDGLRGLSVERVGDVALALEHEEGALAPALVAALASSPGVRAVVARPRPRSPRDAGPARVLAGTLAETRFVVLEEGLRYVVDLLASPTSTGLFVDEREARRRLRSLDLRGKTVLNAFAHACALSVPAALAGATVTSLDLSKRYLDWGRESLRENGVDPAAHDFIYGDALEWLARLGKKGRRFDLVLLDPPASSTTRRGKRWSVDRDYADLVALGVRCLAPGGTLFAAATERRLRWEGFLAMVARGLAEAGRRALSIETATVPLDFRTVPGRPPALKSAWISCD